MLYQTVRSLRTTKKTQSSVPVQKCKLVNIKISLIKIRLSRGGPIYNVILIVERRSLCRDGVLTKVDTISVN